MAIGAYSKVVSTTRQIDSIHTFIGGERKDITSAWTFVNGARKQVFPSAEIFTEIYAKTTSGSYSQTLSWGRYKIVISGAGGGGASGSWSSGHGTRYTNGGYAGQEKTIFINVAYGQTLEVSGIIGDGGKGGKTGKSINVGGAGGTGYQNGSNGTNQISAYGFSPVLVSGGGGGGSTSLYYNNAVQAIANGGNGGDSRYVKADAWGYGGTGGNGGTTSGSGAAGGAANHDSDPDDHNIEAYPGTSGYVHIYKSSSNPS